MVQQTFLHEAAGGKRGFMSRGLDRRLPQHPRFSRRSALQAGAIGLLGLGANHLAALRAFARDQEPSQARAVIFIFLSGGLSQIDSFDPKPNAPEGIRGEFGAIETRTPGLFLCEHLPQLAQRSNLWSVVRSLTHGTNDHSAGHYMMLTGRAVLPTGFNPNAPSPTDEPSIAAIANAVLAPRTNLPPAIVLPERLIHNTGRIIPGQFAGIMGAKRDPWFVEGARFDPAAYGAFPEYEFDHQERPHTARRKAFEIPSLSLPEGFTETRFIARANLLEAIDRQRAALDRVEAAAPFDSHREGAIALLTDPKVRRAFDLSANEASVLERYGENAFGWSLLMARRLVECGVSLIQVNLGNNETWDTHGNAFPHLKEKLLPPTDRAVSALLDDLEAIGLLDSTLIVMAGEFGRTPRISTLPQHYKLPGRDHWGRVQSVFLAGGGVAGGRVVGSTDAIGGHPTSSPQTPENLAATIYSALGLPREAAWHDDVDRPHLIYHGDPITGLS
jgi:hypothetical protein